MDRTSHQHVHYHSSMPNLFTGAHLCRQMYGSLQCFPSNNSGILISSIKNFTLCAAQSLDWCPQSIHLQCTLWIFVVGTHFNLQITSTLCREICHCHDCHGFCSPTSQADHVELEKNERPRFSKENDLHISIHYSTYIMVCWCLLSISILVYLEFTLW